MARRQARWLTLRIEAPAQPDPVGGSGPEDGRTRGTAEPGDGCRADSYRPWSATTRAAPQSRQPPLSACLMASAPTHDGAQTPKPAPSGRRPPAHPARRTPAGRRGSGAGPSRRPRRRDNGHRAPGFWSRLQHMVALSSQKPAPSGRTRREATGAPGARPPAHPARGHRRTRPEATGAPGPRPPAHPARRTPAGRRGSGAGPSRRPRRRDNGHRAPVL